MTTQLMMVAKAMAPEAGPDDLAALGVSVDLGEHIIEDVGDREEKIAGAEGEAEAQDSDDARLAGPDEVGAQEQRSRTWP
jgi:hypothetical protein